MVGETKVSKIYWMHLDTCYLKETKQCHGHYADLDKCPKCGCNQYKRKKDGGDDNNSDDKNEPVEIRGKNKKVNRGAPVRVAWYFHSSAEKMVCNKKGGQTHALA
jgi:hypothetical protein